MSFTSKYVNPNVIRKTRKKHRKNKTITLTMGCLRLFLQSKEMRYSPSADALLFTTTNGPYLPHSDRCSHFRITLVKKSQDERLPKQSTHCHWTKSVGGQRTLFHTLKAAPNHKAVHLSLISVENWLEKAHRE